MNLILYVWKGCRKKNIIVLFSTHPQSTRFGGYGESINAWPIMQCSNNAASVGRIFFQVLDPWENSCSLASLTSLRSQILLYSRATHLCITTNTSMGIVMEGGVRLRRASVSAGKTFQTFQTHSVSYESWNCVTAGEALDLFILIFWTIKT